MTAPFLLRTRRLSVMAAPDGFDAASDDVDF
jgi:hypothetical protein